MTHFVFRGGRPTALEQKPSRLGRGLRPGQAGQELLSPADRKLVHTDDQVADLVPCGGISPTQFNCRALPSLPPLPPLPAPLPPLPPPTLHGGGGGRSDLDTLGLGRAFRTVRVVLELQNLQVKDPR